MQTPQNHTGHKDNHGICLITTSKKNNVITFDTDSKIIGVDNRCSACISHQRNEFITPLRDTNVIITGFGGHKYRDIKAATLKWEINNDQGSRSTFIIPNSFYAPEGGCRLLSPQHWAAETEILTGKEAKETTHSNRIVLTCEDKSKTVMLDKHTNVGNINNLLLLRPSHLIH